MCTRILAPTHMDITMHQELAEEEEENGEGDGGEVKEKHAATQEQRIRGEEKALF